MSSNAWSTRTAAPRAAAPTALELVAWLEILLLAALAFAVRLAWLDADLHIDELYHLLAAQGWNEEGAPRIGGGVYERAFLFTALIAWTQDLFGHSVLAARLPSVLTGTALVLALFLWTRQVAGSLAAWVAGLLLAFSPLAVELSQLVRFYALHALLFWLAAICAWRASAPALPMASRLAPAALGLLCAVAAAHLQLLTLIGFAGIGLWLAGLLAPRLWSWLQGQGLRGAALGLALAFLGALALAALLQSGLAEQLLQRYRWTPLWAQQYQNQIHFYHGRLAEQYPALWPLTAFAAIAALAWRSRAAAFCATIFGTAFVAASFAGMKDDRYLFFALPFLFALWGIGVAAIWQPLAAATLELAARALAATAPWLRPRGARLALVGGAFVFMLSASGAPARLAFDLARQQLPEGPGRITSDWRAAPAALAPWLERADIVVTSNEMAALFHLGRADVLISGTRLSEVGDGLEFSRDPRTGVPVISEPASFLAVVACHADGLVILSERDLAFGWAVGETMLGAITSATTELNPSHLPELSVFWWQARQPARPGCPQPIEAESHG